MAQEGVAGPSRNSYVPQTPRPPTQQGDRAPSRSSVLSYVTIQRGSRPAPIDVDAMDVEDDGPPVFLANQGHQAADPPMPAPAPGVNPRRAEARPAFNHPLFDNAAAANSRAPSGIDWLNVDFTRAPPGGWKKIQFRSWKDVLKGQDAQQAKRWREIARTRRRRPPPVPWPQGRGRAPSGQNISPYYILIIDLTEAQQATMLGWVWRSSKWLSAYFVQFPTPLPTYIATWEGATAFASMSPEDVEDMLAAGFQREPLLTATARAITNDKLAGPAGKWGLTSTADAFNQTVNSIRVEVLGRLKGKQNAPAPLYVMYCDPPTADPREWEEFRDTIQAHSFGVDGGRSPDLFLEEGECRICHSVDHSVC
ncbi:hypothetical protein EVJ58_g9718 [Rhodofomes roseus]|uniref:Uncharacterized protein n=1 Tax=Rhodofomes roseus TaxID=34475 RepID=A0A4Y9XU56_9APHY|nr:hypothetical protein EVJ58_g9718 [Rhodofomes roseus]